MMTHTPIAAWFKACRGLIATAAFEITARGGSYGDVARVLRHAADRYEKRERRKGDPSKAGMAGFLDGD